MLGLLLICGVTAILFNFVLAMFVLSNTKDINNGGENKWT